MAHHQFHADTELPCRAVKLKCQFATEDRMPNEILILKNSHRQPDPISPGDSSVLSLCRCFPARTSTS